MSLWWSVKGCENWEELDTLDGWGDPVRPAQVAGALALAGATLGLSDLTVGNLTEWRHRLKQVEGLGVYFWLGPGSVGVSLADPVTLARYSGLELNGARVGRVKWETTVLRGIRSRVKSGRAVTHPFGGVMVVRRLNGGGTDAAVAGPDVVGVAETVGLGYGLVVSVDGWARAVALQAPGGQRGDSGLGDPPVAMRSVGGGEGVGAVDQLDPLALEVLEA